MSTAKCDHLASASMCYAGSFWPSPPKVLLLCRSWGTCVPRRSQRLCQLEFWLLVGTTMLDRLWDSGQTKCNTPLMLATSVFGRIHRRPCYVMAQPKSRLDIPWPNDAECMGHVWYHFSCWYPLLFDIESLAGCVGGILVEYSQADVLYLRCPLPRKENEQAWSKVRPPSPLIPHFRLSGFLPDTILGNPTPEVVEKCVPVGS